jgi:protein-tyrosine-phosphatase
LIVGGADTGRAPMAAAILRRLAETRSLNWQIASAGLLGHDGDPAEPEARRAMLAQGLNIDYHQARSLDPAMLAECRMLLCIDSGTAHAMRVRFPSVATITYSLGDLAGRKRDIPDPFRMQIGAWLNYAEELALLLHAAMPRLHELMADRQPDPPHPPALSQSAGAATPANLADPAGIDRLSRLLSLLQDMPAVVEWSKAQRQLSDDLRSIGSQDPLLQSYVDLMIARIEASSQIITPGQVAVLQQAIERLRQPLAQQAIEALQRDLEGWG